MISVRGRRLPKMSQHKDFFINLILALITGILFYYVAYRGDWLILQGQTFIFVSLFFIALLILTKLNTIIKQNVEIKKILGNKEEETRIR